MERKDMNIRDKGGFIPVRYKSPRIKNSNGAAATPAAAAAVAVLYRLPFPPHTQGDRHAVPPQQASMPLPC